MIDQKPSSLDAIVIGGGFYGVNIALYLAVEKKKKEVIILEKESDILTRASQNNQARIHNGYHYPRSFTTAYRSRINMKRFIEDWPDAVEKKFTHVYAIARNNSKVSAKQFARFCKEIGANIQTANPSITAMFNSRLIEQVFEVEEFVFDANKLREWAKDQLDKAGVTVICNSNVIEMNKDVEGELSLKFENNEKVMKELCSKFIFNCSYSGLNQFLGDFKNTSLKVKHEVAEMVLVKMPESLKKIGVTVMDGPFFSTIPYPSRPGVHSLSHVRYTPHFSWIDEKGIDPYKKLEDYSKSTLKERMLKDSARYLPAMAEAIYLESIFEVKSVLLKNEIDDGRPIMFEKTEGLPGCFSIFGGKIDNIYDVLEKLYGEI
jgi:hypothetical protein